MSRNTSTKMALALCGSWKTAYQIHLCSRPPLHLSLSCTRSDMPSPYQHLEQAQRLRDGNVPFWGILFKLWHPTCGKLTAFLTGAVSSLTFLQQAEMVWQAGWLAVGDPGGFADHLQQFSAFVGVYFAWSVEMIQHVRISWLCCSRL